ADLAEEIARRAGGGPVFLAAHDMGTSVATELMARALAGELELEIAGALLFNGSILLHRASPTTGQKLLRSPGGALLARLMTRWPRGTCSMACVSCGRPCPSRSGRSSATTRRSRRRSVWPPRSTTRSHRSGEASDSLRLRQEERPCRRASRSTSSRNCSPAAL